MERSFAKEVALLRRGDGEIFEGEGITVRTGAECITLAPYANGVAVGVDCTVGNPKIVGSDVLLAVGRRPNTDDLGLNKAGVMTEQQAERARKKLAEAQA